MKALAIQKTQNSDAEIHMQLKQNFSVWGITTDVLMLGSLIIFLNMYLLATGTVRSLIFLPGQVEAGEWWRLLVYPFVHVSWYHLLLDAGAFMLLYAGIEDKNLFHRISHVFICSAVSLCVAWMFSPSIHEIGLCGLSGVAHGLMVISALEMMQRSTDFKIGLICLIILISKTIYEVITGDSLLSFLLFGMCGTPLVACHAGGVIGGVMSYRFVRRIKKS